MNTAAEPKPTSSAIASTGSGGRPISRPAATSSRRRLTRSASVSPVMAWNTRWKCQEEKCATPGQHGQIEWIGEMAVDVIDHAVDARDVGMARARHQPPRGLTKIVFRYIFTKSDNDIEISFHASFQTLSTRPSP
nr:hypothetical protein [Variovorax sp. MHTC-1]